VAELTPVGVPSVVGVAEAYGVMGSVPGVRVGAGVTVADEIGVGIDVSTAEVSVEFVFDEPHPAILRDGKAKARSINAANSLLDLCLTRPFCSLSYLWMPLPLAQTSNKYTPELAPKSEGLLKSLGSSLFLRTG
jgi:hypothetical protein